MKIIGPTFNKWNSEKGIEKQIIVMMSGGVDSSVTAMLYKQQGWDVLGITMKLPVSENCDFKRSCCGTEAAYVAKDIGIAHYYLDIREEFHNYVIESFRNSYLSGQTPSPCVDCNTIIKFSLAWDFLIEYFGVTNLTTGHYAKIIKDNEKYYLARGDDKSRDQSYFLYGINADKLKNLYFPLESYTKDQVRAMAYDAKLNVSKRADSMELCFAGEGDYRDALGIENVSSGAIYDIDGNILGEHNGIHNFTIGQRRGLKIAMGKPVYVVKINSEDNSITVGSYDQAMTNKVYAKDINILIPDKIKAGCKLFGKIRSQGDPAPCVIISADDSIMEVVFDEPLFAVTPGQRLVLYDENEYIAAGGIIFLK